MLNGARQTQGFSYYVKQILGIFLNLVKGMKNFIFFLLSRAFIYASRSLTLSSLRQRGNRAREILKV